MEDIIDKAHSTYASWEALVLGNLKGRDHLQNLELDGRRDFYYHYNITNN